MEYKKLKFSPEEGFLDSNFYEDTPKNSREILQRQHNQTRDFINSVVDRLNCGNEGESGLESIKSPKIEGVFGNNGYEQIKDVKRQLNNIALNEVPDGSITDLKLAGSSVTNDKIKDKEITSEKFSDDCVVPFSDETRHINGIKASDYAPVSVTGTFDTFKEYVAKTDIYNLYGKTHNNIRYILYNKYMYSLNLLTEEFKKISDIELDNSYRFFIGKDEKIYLAGYSLESYIGAAGITMYDGYISIYEYSLEYSELVLKNKMKVAGTTLYSQVLDAEYDGENIYIGLINSSSNSVWHSLYKIKFEEMETVSEVSEIYGFYAPRNDYLFLAGEDLVFNNKIFKNCNVEEVSELEYTVYGYDNGCLLVKGSNVFMVDKNTMEPKIIRTVTMDGTGFMHNGNFYQIIVGFIVKLRLL